MKLQRFLLFTACLGLASAASATSIIVRPDGSGDYPTIQQAVDAAEDGDIILLESGTFVGPENRDILVSEKSISIRGGDPSTCVIDCQDMGRAFRLVGRFTASSIAGLTIVHGSGTKEAQCTALHRSGPSSPIASLIATPRRHPGERSPPGTRA